MIILQRLIQERSEETPIEWQYHDLKNFGLQWELFPYQIQALENTISLLNFLYSNFKEKGEDIIKMNKELLINSYRLNGLTNELESEISINNSDDNYKFLSQFFDTGTYIPFKSFANRAAFWMATGSGKTLVMIKLLAVLANLINKGLIPQKDILILAPKDEIISQIKEHVEIFNKGSEITINLRNLKEWENIKNQQSSSFSKTEINVFYYRADNIADKDTISKKKDGQRIGYESYYNNGNWYLILDEAHKGEKEFSQRQRYFMAMTHNGFLFNFSATFTDELDHATTIFDYKLDTFLKDGYGKKIYIADSDFKNFNTRKSSDFSEIEKKDIIAQTLIVLATIKGQHNKLKTISKKLYHSPLLITQANSVNTETADLKIFYSLLSDIARGKFDFEKAKDNLIEKIENKTDYVFGLGEIEHSVIGKIHGLGKKDFFKSVFNTNNPGNIEVVKFKDNSRELAFKLANSDKYFMLIVASDVINWENNVLEGYEMGGVVDESFFNNINHRNDINILLGSRIFAEGWDTNRPNVINFINMGVGEAKKFILQSIGRGIRIEPIKNKRKRFEYLDEDIFSKDEKDRIKKENQLLESLFIFATNKDVVQGIVEGLEKQGGQQWIKLNNIKRTEGINEKILPLFIPIFKDGGQNNHPFWIGQKELDEVTNYVQNVGPKILILKNRLKLRTYNKIVNVKNFIIDDKRRKKSIDNILSIADNYFNETIRVFDEIKILDGEISHFNEVRTNINSEEITKLEKDLIKILTPRMSEEEIDNLLDNKKINLEEYKRLIKQINEKPELEVINDYLDYAILREHYYSPILFKKDTDHFQHIIKVPSEIDFLKKLKTYLLKEGNKLKDYDWWYFSKIDESIDKISIPYFDSEKGEYRKYYPDFIFWLKKGNKYSIIFVDPKGVEYPENAIMKINGFNQFKEQISRINKIIIDFKLSYFHAIKPEIMEDYKEYWTNDLDKIF